MANAEHLAVLGRGITHWNAWRKENPDVRPDLARVDLDVANLNGADFNKAHLRGTDLHRADLSRANLRRANLTGATLKGANLSGADLRGANLSGANLAGAELSEANLGSAVLYEANFTGALLGETVLANVDLTNTIGLDTCRHWGVSIVDRRTLLCSQNLPATFLEGCGLRDLMFEHLPALLSQIETPSPSRKRSIALLVIETNGGWSAGELAVTLNSLSDLYELRLALALMHEDLTLTQSFKHSLTGQPSYLRRIFIKQLPHLLKDHLLQLLQLVRPEERLVVRNVSYRSPGSIDIAGIAPVIAYLKDFLTSVMEHRSYGKTSTPENVPAAIASNPLQIENARKLLSLGSELGLGNEDLQVLVDYVLGRQAHLAQLAERRKIQSVISIAEN